MSNGQMESTGTIQAVKQKADRRGEPFAVVSILDPHGGIIDLRTWDNDVMACLEKYEQGQEVEFAHALEGTLDKILWVRRAGEQPKLPTEDGEPPSQGLPAPQPQATTALAPLHKWKTARRDQIVRLADVPAQYHQAILEEYGLPLDLKPQFVISLMGKPYPTHEALMDLLGKGERPKLVSLGASQPQWRRCQECGCTLTEGDVDRWGATVGATVVLRQPDGQEVKITRWGRACPHNTNAVTQKHLAELAETRAMNRALRSALAIEATSVEEEGAGDNGKAGA
jgi:hypothetical protein